VIKKHVEVLSNCSRFLSSVVGLFRCPFALFACSQLPQNLDECTTTTSESQYRSRQRQSRSSSDPFTRANNRPSTHAIPILKKLRTCLNAGKAGKRIDRSTANEEKGPRRLRNDRQNRKSQRFKEKSELSNSTSQKTTSLFQVTLKKKTKSQKRSARPVHH
jgi:hypothetical protein